MEKDKKYLPDTLRFLQQYIALTPANRSYKKDNDKVSHAALFYEKFRVAVEYQEDHLIFKNAVRRIVTRKCALSFGVTSQTLFDDLMTELAWADYLNIDALTDGEIAQIKSIVSRYLVLINNVKSEHMPRREAQKIVIGWMASEIDEVLYSRNQQELLIDFAFQVLKKNLTNQASGDSFVNELQLKFAILPLLFKPDFSYAQYWLIKKIYPAFYNFSQELAVEIGANFDNIILRTDSYFKNPFAKNYLSYTKKYIVPFILIKELLASKRNLPLILDDPERFKLWLMETYDEQTRKAHAKVWRGTFRALLFIIITKISLAFIIEMPFDQFLKGSIAYFPLMMNILLPPLLMLLSGLSIKNPPARNREVVSQAIDNLITFEQIGAKTFRIENKKKSALEIAFNAVFLILNLCIVSGVIYLLNRIGFNFVSIILFFFFVSAVSFFSFRIRNITLQLIMQVSRENPIISSIEFLFLPFILIGKSLSAVITKSNPFTITLDFLIEAPLKSIIKITNSWLRFVQQIRDDIDA